MQTMSTSDQAWSTVGSVVPVVAVAPATSATSAARPDCPARRIWSSVRRALTSTFSVSLAPMGSDAAISDTSGWSDMSARPWTAACTSSTHAVRSRSESNLTTRDPESLTTSRKSSFTGAWPPSWSTITRSASGSPSSTDSRDTSDLDETFHCRTILLEDISTAYRVEAYKTRRRLIQDADDWRVPHCRTRQSHVHSAEDSQASPDTEVTALAFWT